MMSSYLFRDYCRFNFHIHDHQLIKSKDAQVLLQLFFFPTPIEDTIGTHLPDIRALLLVHPEISKFFSLDLNTPNFQPITEIFLFIVYRMYFDLKNATKSV